MMIELQVWNNMLDIMFYFLYFTRKSENYIEKLTDTIDKNLFWYGHQFDRTKFVTVTYIDPKFHLRACVARNARQSTPTPH